MTQKGKQKNVVLHFTFIHLPGSISSQTLLPVLLLLVAICSLPTAAICWLSWQIATVPTLDSGLIALVMKSHSMQAIYGLSASVCLVRHVWSTWDQIYRREFLHTLLSPVEIRSALRTQNLKNVSSSTFSTDYVLGLLCFALHFWKKPQSWSPQHWTTCPLGFLNRHPTIQGLCWGGHRVEFLVIFLITQSQTEN